MSRYRSKNITCSKKSTALLSGRHYLRKCLAIFKENVFDKRLKTHRLKGNLKEYYAFSISYSDRIVFKIIDDDSVYFIEIGSHDVCY